MKQVGVEVELSKNSPSDVVADTQVTTEELEMTQVTPKPVFRRSYRTIRVLVCTFITLSVADG